MSGRRALHQVRRHASACAFQQLATFVDSRLLHAARVFRMRTQMPTPESVEAAVEKVMRMRKKVTVKL